MQFSDIVKSHIFAESMKSSPKLYDFFFMNHYELDTYISIHYLCNKNKN